MNISMSYYSHIGRRANNEDSMAAIETSDGMIAVVADGLGGHQNGEYASREAVNTLSRLLIDEEISEDGLEDAILAADEAVRQLHGTAPGALTTIAALWISGSRAIAANVGDTRIYQFRDGKVQFQSTDHSAAQLAVLAGEITPEQIRGHADRNKLIRVLGAESAPRVAQTMLDVRSGDCFLLCSDGFWEQISEDKMLSIASRHTEADGWLGEMRETVVPRAKDNNTAIALIVN